MEDENANKGDDNSDDTQSSANDAPHAADGGKSDKGGGTDWSKFPDIATHPRWQEREADWKKRFNEQEERHEQSLQELRDEFKEYTPKRETSAKVPAWFGGDEDAWEQFQEHQKQERQALREELTKEFEGKTKQEQDAIEKATVYMNEQIDEIEADKTLNPNSAKIDKNKLLQYVLDNELVDTKGNWNYKAGFRMMKAENKTPLRDITGKKNLANAMFDEGSSDNPSQVKPMTSDDFKKGERPW